MKKVLLKLVAIILVVVSSFSVFGCNLSSDDVNDIVDNAYEKYSQMNNTETGSYSKFKDINVESSYLGYGYDVINSPYMDVQYVKNYSIIDKNKIDNLQLEMRKANKHDKFTVEEETITNFNSSYATKFNLNGKYSTFFAAGLEMNFSGSSSKKTHYRFIRQTYYHDSFYILITNHIDELQEFLSERFKNDLLNMSIEKLFNTYGTHLIKSATMGGRIDRSLTYYSESSMTAEAFKVAVDAHASAFGIEINSSVSTEATTKLENSGINFKERLSQSGGKSVSEDGEKISYEQWNASLDDSLEYATLCGIKDDDSLVGLWELLPSGNESRAEEIENKFLELSSSKYNEVCNQFQLLEPDTTWEEIAVTMNRQHCAHDTKYDPSTEGNKDYRKIHEGWELGELVFNGLEKVEDKYVIKDQEAFSIKYHLLENIKDLPIGTMSNTFIKHKLSSDGADRIYGLNEFKKTVGLGAYFIQITYTDNTNDFVFAGNFLKDKSPNTYIDILSAKTNENDGYDTNKYIKNITIVVVYETDFGNYADWRCEYTLNFA